MMRLTTFAAASTLAFHAMAADCPANRTYPGAEWPSKIAETAQSKAAEIKALEDYAFTLVEKDADRKGIRTDGVVIIKGGQLIYERYARGFDAKKRHIAWSVSKSFTSALVGGAIKEELLSLDDSICKYIPNVLQDNCGITVKHLIEFSSGLDWREIYEGQSNQASSTLAMLYGEGSGDMASFVANHPRRDAPGESWEYSTGESTLLAAVVTSAVKPKMGETFPWKMLLDPIGMKSALWERDRAGTIVGGSWLYANPRDFARFGYLYLNDGCWAGTRVLPESWVQQSTQVVDAIKKKAIDRDDKDVQGRQWWLNKPVPELEQKTPYPDVPEDAFMALGHWGQSITIIPSLDLVIVRTGDDRETGILDKNTFLKLAIAVGK
jgi:CubicO group peptidase (beta-lactamase class C family)